MSEDAVKVIVVAVGEQADGGVEALAAILSPLPADLPAVILVAMHQEKAGGNLAQVLDAACALPVREARSGTPVYPGFVYTAPRNFHLTVAPPGVLWLTVEEKVHGARPAADPLFRSVAKIYGDRVIGIILTGDDGDGAAGIQAIRAAGGSSIAQDEGTSTNPSMPRSAIETGRVELVLRLREIAPILEEMALSQSLVR